MICFKVRIKKTKQMFAKTIDKKILNCYNYIT